MDCVRDRPTASTLNQALYLLVVVGEGEGEREREREGEKGADVPFTSHPFNLVDLMLTTVDIEECEEEEEEEGEVSVRGGRVYSESSSKRTNHHPSI